MKLLITVFKSETIKFLLSNNSDYYYPRITFLAIYQRFDLLEMLYKATDAFLDVESLFDQYPEYGKLESLKYLTEMGAKCSTAAMDEAAESGHFDVVKWLHENRTEGCTESAIDLAAGNGHLEVVKFLHFNRSEGFSTPAMNEAAENGYLEIVKRLHENRTEGCTYEAMDGASQFGYLDVVQFLHLNRTEGCDRDLVYATEYCHFEIVKYLVENSLGLDRLQEALNVTMEEYLECDDPEKVFLDIKRYLGECLSKLNQ